MVQVLCGFGLVDSGPLGGELAGGEVAVGGVGPLSETHRHKLIDIVNELAEMRAEVAEEIEMTGKNYPG